MNRSQYGYLRKLLQNKEVAPLRCKQQEDGKKQYTQKAERILLFE